MKVTIPKRFCGPPESGNGGYTGGLVANALGGAVEVTLRKPIPIDREMEITIEGDTAFLKDGDALIAEGRRARFEPSLIPPLSFEDAEFAETMSPAFKDHPFPTCFVCGPQREEGDGLRIFPGPVPQLWGQGIHYFASGWIPDKEFANASGIVRDEFLWAAMDCPTGFAAGFPYQGKLVTGRLAVNVQGDVRAGERCVIVSWPFHVEGRKHHASAALMGEDGSMKVQARATWIKLD